MTVGVVAAGWYQPDPIDGVAQAPKPVVAFAADRMITVGAGRREFEQRHGTKAFPFTDRMMALISGYGDVLGEVLVRAFLRCKADTIVEVRAAAEVIKEEFHAERNRMIEDAVLRKYNMSWSEFYARERSMSEDMRSRILRDIEWEEPLGSILFAGIDNSHGGWQSFIYEITDPGKIIPANQAGYKAIGIGREHAEAVFMDTGYTKGYWEYAVLLTYEAKKRGELAAGVGGTTGLWWITPDAPRYYAGPGTSLSGGLDAIVEERRRKEGLAVEEDRIAFSQLWRKESGGEPAENKEAQADPEERPDEEGISGSTEEGEQA